MPIPCPHCRNVVDPVETVAHGEAVCPVCGSGFRLDEGATVEWTSLAGRKVGRFELVEGVGRGAFGIVYKARDPDLGRLVAVKVPRPGRATDPQAQARFVREAQSVAQLTHPGIVPVLEVGEIDGVPYVVSEFVSGPTLSDFLSAGRPPSSEAARIIGDLADALQYAHQCGVVHRDVKPSNVLLDDAAGGAAPATGGLRVGPLGRRRSHAHL